MTNQENQQNSYTKPSNFTTFQNDLIRNPSLSCKAFKLLSIGLSHSGKWIFRKKQIATCFKEGMHTVDGAMKELRKLGYLHLKASQDSENLFDGHQWFWFANPINNDEFKLFLRDGGFQGLRELRGSEVSTDIRRPIQKKTNSEEEEKEDKSRNKVAPSKHAFGLASFLFEKIKENDSCFRIKKLDTWAKDLDRMHKIDKRPWEQIKELIIFATEHEFWRTNILCAAKLRKQATTLKMQMEKDSSMSKEEIADERQKANVKKAREIEKKYSLEQNIIRYWPDYLEVKISNGPSVYRESLSYGEHGFHEQLESLLRIGGWI